MRENANRTSGLLNERASVKMGGPNNNAYAGVPQEDDPRAMDSLGEMELTPDANAVLGAYLTNIFEHAKNIRASNGIDEELMQCLRNFKGVYAPDELEKIKLAGMPEVFFPLSEHKVHTAIAWVDEFFTNAEKIISLHPTPKPETNEDVNELTMRRVRQDLENIVRESGQIPPPEMMQEYAAKMRPLVEKAVMNSATDRALRMERVLKDDMVQGKWALKIHDLITQVCIYGSAALRSPVVKMRKRLAWVNGKVERKDRTVREFEVVSPFDLFPSAGMTDTQCGDLCVRVRFTPLDLVAMKAIPLWIPEKIDEVVSAYGVSGVRVQATSDEQVKMLTEQTDIVHSRHGIVEGFEFWGQVSGKDLVGIGVKKDPNGNAVADSAVEWYEVNAIVVAGKVIYCRIMDDAEERPLDVLKFYDTPGQFFGRGPLHLINHLQKICNAAGRAMIANMGFAAGPQVVIDPDALSANDNYKLYPLKVWLAKQNSMNPNAKPVAFFNVDSHANELKGVFEFYQRLADEITGIPAYANGTDAAVGAARTATGLNMLFGAANKGIKKFVGNADEIVSLAVRRLYWWHMLYNPDMSIKGDVHIEVQGLKHFASKTSQMNEMMGLIRVVGQDPRFAQLQDPLMLSRLIRKMAIMCDADPDDFAPTEDVVAQKMAEQQAQQAMEAEQQQQMMMAQAAQAQGGNGSPREPSGTGMMEVAQ